MADYLALETTGHLLLEAGGGLLLEVQVPEPVTAHPDDWSPQFIQAQQLFYAREQALVRAKQLRDGDDATLEPADWLDDDLLAAIILLTDV